MLSQKDMEYNMLMAHRQFISGLEKSLDMLKDDIDDVEGISEDCTDEWCKSREDFLDYLHKRASMRSVNPGGLPGRTLRRFMN